MSDSVGASLPGAASSDELAAALDDILEKTTWEGRGKNIAPALLAALASRGVSIGAALEAGPEKEDKC